MAAHSYRAWLFQHEGLTVWNAQWYGGHHVLGYSLLFAPLAAAIGPALVGVLAALAAVALFAPLARAAAPSPRGGRRRRVAVHRRRALQRRRSGGCRSCSGSRSAVGAWAARAAASGACSPRRARAGGDAGEPGRGRVPDARRARRKLLADGRAGARAARAGSALPALAGGVALVPAVPRGRRPTASRRPRSGRCSRLAPRASRCSRPAGGRCGPAALLYLGVLVGRVRRPDAVRAERAAAGVLAGPSVLAARPPRARAACSRWRVVGVGLLYLQWLPGGARRRRGARRPVDAARLPGRGARLPRRTWPSPASASRCR